MDKEYILKKINEDNSYLTDHNKYIRNPKLDYHLLDRPSNFIPANNLSLYLEDFIKRFKHIGIRVSRNTNDVLKEFLNFLNGDVSKLTIYHWSIVPLKMSADDFKVDNIYISSLNTNEFQSIAKEYRISDHTIEQNSCLKNNSTIIISEVVIESDKAQHHNRHIWFDKLDEIYSNHLTLAFLLQFHYSDNLSKLTSISSDNFPFAGVSWSNSKHSILLNDIKQESLIKIKTLMNFLKNKLYYRLIIQSEYTSKHIFENIVFLRSMIDPFLSKNDPTIKSISQKQNLHKTIVQARLIKNTLLNQNTPNSHVPLDLLKDFLKIRNKLIHPSPTRSIAEFHKMYDNITLLRKSIYEFVQSAIEIGINDNLNEFEINISP
ncbi:hypothetical protein [Marixanthomonas spongiae]|uniref:Apea-like HEPN domain-containing protein n=1 Tax=Marixanthomonas spongiae TaxID=2174845 RepID=A0A2U0I243_9FLAO|nr:hypothetical protein [Marixanthomonas spongiae]PVW15182.1 hypothetical protein DDV96_07175 [Marixanthomonas spongiae]